MFRLQIILVSGAAFSIMPSASFAMTPEEPKFYGSLYPDDVSQSEPQAGDYPVAPARAPSASGVFPELERALGPAGYIVTTQSDQTTFAALIRRAVGRHPAFHAQASNLEESSSARKRARSALLPQLSAQLRGDYSITRDFAANTDNVVESLRPREQFTAGVSASQLIFDGGATIQRIRSARALDQEYKNALSTRINDLSINALTAYYDVAAHQALVKLGRAFINRHEKILEDVKERERLGAGSKADVTRARARLAASRARLSEIEESKRFADIRYEEFFGDRPKTLSRPDVSAPLMETRNEMVAEALANNPQLAAAEARTAAKRADFKAAKGARYPEVRLSVDAVKYDVFDTGDDFDVRAGLNVNYNLFSGGARAADISIARSQAKRESFNESLVRQEVARDAAMAFERLQGADERLSALAEAVIAHNETRDLVLERYKLSRGDLIDVLQAENDYFEAGVAYLTALSTHDMAAYALMEHTGGLLRLFSPQLEYENAIGGAQYE
ncbi:TolC family protein [Hyphococcus flavus]|uniref:TolC family protein n=1 Tax=Hyphococcus flavus TaxID=1866326 RepID=A0AAE9ZEX5_9PROT|nr:TolC family protein [Hyphococcus flavus]WDI32495.1 TolC family protein [Hyphococcus flavus]